jgi:tRNA threonylcarbamoyladenosine biosynthesis protein TsaB
LRILALDSSSLSASCALTRDDVLEAEGYLNCGLTHSQTLMPMLADMLARARVTVSEIDLFAAAVGPGSFTGLRIGIAAVKGMAFAAGRLCAAVSTLEGLAHAVSLHEGTICPVLDARVGQVYAALFECRNGTVRRMAPDNACFIEELALVLPPGALLAGDGAQLVYERLSGRIEGLRLPPAHLRLQRASGVALAARDAPKVSADALSPVYLRLPQAERERLARKAGEDRPPTQHTQGGK